MRMERKTMLLLALAALTAVFSLGFFAGRRTTPYAVTAQVQRKDVSEETPEAEQPEEPPETDETQKVSCPIDLNTATKEELMTLPRIGEKIAQRILDYRTQYGRFSAPEQLMDVEGIGEATFEGLKDLVTVEERQ